MDVNNPKTSRHITIIVGIAFFIIMLMQYYVFRDPNRYEGRIQESRDRRDQIFKESDESPLLKDDKKKFSKLSYFSVDNSYYVQAALLGDDKRDTIILTTTTGDDYPLIRAGKLSFELQGQSITVGAYRYLDSRKKDLFVPFTDMTSGLSTYGGGRYLDIPFNRNETIYIDFNHAYNPYCVYNENYSCPIPPSENKIPIEIRAGERKFEL